MSSKGKKKFRKPMGLKLDDSVCNDQDALGMSYTVGSDGKNFHRKDVRLDSGGALIVKGKKSGKSIEPGDLETVGVLGRGASSYVNKVRHVPTDQLMALKVINIYDKSKRAQLMQEIYSLFNARCGALVAFHGAFFNDNQINIALEYMNEGCLETVVKSRGVIPEKVLAAVTFQILWGLAYLKHEKRVHRDIKPQNILVNDRGEVKLTDFGISKELEETMGQCMTFVGTFKYMSPERIENKKYDFAADIWSLGIVLMECATGTYPFAECHSYIEMVQTVLEADCPTLDSGEFSPEFCEFIKMCIHKKPGKRVPADVLMGAPWLTQNGANSLKDCQTTVRNWLGATATGSFGIEALSLGGGGGEGKEGKEAGGGESKSAKK